jgi:hypothetical protein
MTIITLQEAIKKLNHLDEWKVVIDEIRALREATLADLGPCKDPYEVMKLAGGTARLDELLAILNG